MGHKIHPSKRTPTKGVVVDRVGILKTNLASLIRHELPSSSPRIVHTGTLRTGGVVVGAGHTDKESIDNLKRNVLNQCIVQDTPIERSGNYAILT